MAGDIALAFNHAQGSTVLNTSNAARQSGPGAARFGETIATNENTILGQLIAMGVSQTNATHDAELISAAYGTSATYTPQQLKVLAASLGITVSSSSSTALSSAQNAALWNTSSAVVKNGLGNVAVNLILWEGALEKAGVSGGVAAAAQNALTAFIAKNGPITANEMAVFQSMATNTAMSASTMSADVATISAFVAKHGPLTTTEMLAIQNDLANGVTSAFDINLTLLTVNANLQPAIQSAQGIAKQLASLHKSIPGTVNLTGGGKGLLGFSTGGVAEYPESGGLAMLHGTEAVVPKAKAGWLWPMLMTAIATGAPPSP